MHVLTLASTSGDGRRFEVSLSDGPLTIGRSEHCNIEIDDALISRFHAQLELRQDIASIVDLDSKNGTWVNGRRVHDLPVEIRGGDLIKLGETTLRVESADDPTRSIAPSRSHETITVLFADLEGHTALFEELGHVAAHELVSHHVSRMQDVVASSGGTTVKTEGDGLIAVFRSVGDAINCAVGIQRWSRAPDAATRRVPIRIAINTGDAILEDEDVFGVAVITAARMMSHAAGGEILISDASRLLLGKTVDVELVSRGWLNLKGISEPIRVYAAESLD